ncbi:S-adenosyl-L-methionine-dependent methyltransferase [Testicularia cyperi]|uniref:S-adenosyl-L-methionine-dependent methyltransferase n=1 Tax=Testicularia cyperi TaxID=1882483 RepID=A0A317XHR8_9BASI|nr:S-adenosyl-L-methionine-dependent methyltransferase [Testicularia cyperi]
MSNPTYPTYTQGYSEAVLKSHASRTAENSAAFLIPHLRPDANILDVGCGPGTISASFLPYVPQGSVKGIDYSQHVVDSARKRAAEIDGAMPPNLSFEAASVFELPFADNSFDMVYTHQMLLHLPNAVDAIREMRRVCKTGGIVAIREGDWSVSLVYPECHVLELWKSVAEDVFRTTGAEPNAGRRLITWALEAGYDSSAITYSSSNQTYAGAPTASWWGQMWADRCRGDEWTRKAIQTGRVTQSDVDLIVRHWIAWSLRPDSVFVLLCGEVLLRK